MSNHHPIIEEFPDIKDKIHSLKISNNHFRRLMEKYETIDKEIVSIEQEIHVSSDKYLEDLKKQRLQLKDEMYRILTA